MKRISLPYLILSGIVALFLLLYFSMYTEFKEANNFEQQLEQEGYTKEPGEMFSFISDGIFYFFSRNKQRQGSHFTHRIGTTTISLYFYLRGSNSESGTSNVFPDIKVNVQLSGREDLFHYKDDYQHTTIGDYSPQNSTYSQLGAKLKNGIPIRTSYSQRVVDCLSKLENIEGTYCFEEGNVWYPQKGVVNCRIRFINAKKFKKELQTLITIYEALTY